MGGEEKRTALVTGANRGIGQQVAKDLARAGWNVLVGARDRAKGEAAVARVKKEGGGKVRVRHEPLDVADETSIGALASRLEKAKIRLAALVNNAGVYGEARDPRNYRAVVTVNFFGPLRVTDALAPSFEDGANVVMVSSRVGELSNLPEPARTRLAAPDLDREGLLSIVDEILRAAESGRRASRGGHGFPRDSYGFSKAALNALTRVLARERPAWHVNAVCPGWVRTDMGGRGAPRSVEEGAAGVTWAAMLAEGGPSGGFFRDRRKVPF